MTQISAKVLARSRSVVTGKIITTFELIYPRFILAELNTHSLLKRNSASSRAIPIAKVIEQVRNDYAMPVHWGKNQPGMSAKEELVAPQLNEVKGMWEDAAMEAAYIAEKMDKCGAHKQVANRIMEPFQWMKTVLTATEFDNFFYLRRHPDADPNIAALAECMWQAMHAAPIFDLYPGEWHVPYVHRKRACPRLEGSFGPIEYWDLRDAVQLTLEQALAVSSSCCAQTSFRTTDDSIEKAQRIFERLVESKPVHASPFEHQATPMQATKGYSYRNTVNDYGVNNIDVQSWEPGITHMDRKCGFWSGNLNGFIQHRQLLPDNTCWNYEEQINE